MKDDNNSEYLVPVEIALRLRVKKKKLDLKKLRWHKEYCLSERPAFVEDKYLEHLDEEIKILEAEIVKIEFELMEVMKEKYGTDI